MKQKLTTVVSSLSKSLGAGATAILCLVALIGYVYVKAMPNNAGQNVFDQDSIAALKVKVESHDRDLQDLKSIVAKLNETMTQQLIHSASIDAKLDIFLDAVGRNPRLATANHVKR